MIKLAIFDLDGTLTDTIEDLADSVNFSLEFFGYPTHELEKYKYFVGSGIPNLIRRASPNNCSEEELLAIRKKFFEYYRVHYLDKTKVYDKIYETLDNLNSMGVKLAVCSNKAEEMTEKILSALFSGRFSALVGQSERYPIKPAPDSVYYILDKLSVEAFEAVFIGDSGVDMQTAKNSGMIGIGVTWGFRTKEELIENGADYIAEEPLDIIKIIEKV